MRTISQTDPVVTALADRISILEASVRGVVGPVLASLMPARALAERLGHRDRHGDVTVRVLESWRARGIGPAYVRVGRIPYYRPDVVDEWLLENQYRSTREEVVR